MAEPTPSTFLHTLRVLCAALMAALVMIAVAVVATLGEDGTGNPPVLWLAVLVALALGAAALIGAIGYRVKPIAPGTAETEARASSARQLQSATILRFALGESVGIVGVATAFIAETGGIYLCLLGVVLAEALMFWHVWPSERIIARTQEALETEGGRSYLREALDSPPPTNQAV